MLGSSSVLATIPAEDLDRAKKFYTEILGLKIVAEPSFGAIIFEAGSGSRIFMYQRDRSTAQHTALSFEVDDIEAVVEGLTAKGVTFEQYDMGELKTDSRGIASGTASTGDTKAAWLTDPENNIIGLFSG